MTSNLTLTDLFCGAGGSSTGAIDVPGVSVRVASNHWQLAVDTHAANHGDTGHVCADLSQIDPRYYPRTDILWASPECTNHSIAKGARRDPQPDLFNPVPDEAAERSRATMWDVPRFTEVHRYQAIIVENVVDVARWHPYRAWLMAMDSLGYDHEIVYMNSMHAWAHGDAAPQSRDRFYGVFWRKGNRRPDLGAIQQPPAWCPEHGDVRAMKAWKNTARAGRYRSQYRFVCPHTECRGREVTPHWKPASSIIDWTDLGQRIGDRARPLADKTLRRIQAGIDRYWTGTDHDALMVNNVSGADATRSTPVSQVAPTMVAGGLHASLLVPVEGREGKAARSVAEPYRTQTTRNETGLLTPFVTQFRDGEGRRNLDPAAEPLNTIVADGAGHAIVAPPFITELRGGGSDARSTSQPLATVTASGNHHGLTTPGATPAIEDCSFRMLAPAEIKRAMAFPADYQILGTKREQVRMAGNAVTPPAARDLVAAVATSLEG
jgi:DNA (cytosine-5)-methyltransferase 1